MLKKHICFFGNNNKQKKNVNTNDSHSKNLQKLKYVGISNVSFYLKTF